MIIYIGNYYFYEPPELTHLRVLSPEMIVYLGNYHLRTASNTLEGSVARNDYLHRKLLFTNRQR